MADIILSTLNARYIHSALGLRYLKANMGELEDATLLMEFVLDSRPSDVVEKVLAQKPKIVGFGVYIWNVEQTTHVVGMLKRVAPDVVVVLGGPNVSHEQDALAIVQWADYVITGQADKCFAAFCRQIFAATPPKEKIIRSLPLALDDIKLPYRLYSDEDIAHRVIYVEASRGCPFKCEFCLSALDKTAKPFDLDLFLDEMQALYERGVRHFKFVDRTFNLNVAASVRILDFFLARLDDTLFLHFEVIPDRLPEKLKEKLALFPAGALQLEIGVQTLNPLVQALISRRQDDEKTAENIVWIRNASHAHIHADLIAGLPGEDIESFARGFNRLSRMNPHEIQMGILKRLPGTPVIRHSEKYAMVYSPFPPYTVLSTSCIDFDTMQRIKRFARYWDMIANSGRFSATQKILLADAPFERFMQLSDWLFRKTAQTHKIALKRLFDLLSEGLVSSLGLEPETVKTQLWADFQRSGIKGTPAFIRAADAQKSKRSNASIQSRQRQHRS